MTASKPGAWPWKTSGNSSSQWKKRCASRSSRTMSFALAEGCRKSTGNGACSSRSPGQNQMAHQVSNARPKLAIGGAGSKMLLVDPPALLGLVDRQVMNLLENADQVIVYADGRKLLLEELEGFRAPGADELHEFSADLFLLVLDCLGPLVALLLFLARILALGNKVFAEVMNESVVA